MHFNDLRYRRPLQFVLGKMFIAQTLFAIDHNALLINNENLLPVQLCQSCKQLVIVLDNLCCNQTLRLVLDWQFEHFFFCKRGPLPLKALHQPADLMCQVRGDLCCNQCWTETGS